MINFARQRCVNLGCDHNQQLNNRKRLLDLLSYHIVQSMVERFMFSCHSLARQTVLQLTLPATEKPSLLWNRDCVSRQHCQSKIRSLCVWTIESSIMQACSLPYLRQFPLCIHQTAFSYSHTPQPPGDNAIASSFIRLLSVELERSYDALSRAMVEPSRVG